MNHKLKTRMEMEFRPERALTNKIPPPSSSPFQTSEPPLICGTLFSFSFQGPCESIPKIIPNCYYDYSPEMEDTTELSLPGWRPLPDNTSWPEALRICPKPWRYQKAEKLGIDPVKAVHNTYGGGGYVAVLGYDAQTAHSVLGETMGLGWLDRHTRAVVLEFAAFNINTNLISIATFIYEMIASGAAYTTMRVDTLELYTTESGAVMFYLICQQWCCSSSLRCCITSTDRGLHFSNPSGIWWSS